MNKFMKKQLILEVEIQGGIHAVHNHVWQFVADKSILAIQSDIEAAGGAYEYILSGKFLFATYDIRMALQQFGVLLYIDIENLNELEAYAVIVSHYLENCMNSSSRWYCKYASQAKKVA